MKQYTIDFSHSTIGFSVRHMMISRIYGTFESYSATLALADLEKLNDVQISFSIAAASISTKNFDRDIHLVSPDFLDADLFPKITFVSTKAEKIKDNVFALHGDLTIRDITNPVEFKTTHAGSTTNSWGQEVHKFHAQTEIDRRAFQLVYKTLIETGGILISDEININVELEIHPV